MTDAIHKRNSTTRHKLDYVLVTALNNLRTYLQQKDKRRISKRRSAIATGLISLGNLSMAALFFGQAFGGVAFDPPRAIAGSIVMFVLYAAAYQLLQERTYAD